MRDDPKTVAGSAIAIALFENLVLKGVLKKTDGTIVLAQAQGHCKDEPSAARIIEEIGKRSVT